MSQEFYNLDDIETDPMHKAVRLLKQIVDKEPTLVGRLTSRRPHQRGELANLSTEELVDAVMMQQASEQAIRKI